MAGAFSQSEPTIALSLSLPANAQALVAHCCRFLGNHLEARLSDQAQVRASYTVRILIICGNN